MPPITDPSNRRYVALKQLRIGPYEYRDRGELVPEASEWPHSVVVAMLHTGMLGEGGVCDHEASIATLNDQMDDVQKQLVHLAAERDNLKEQLEAANNDIDDLREELDETKSRLGGSKPASDK